MMPEAERYAHADALRRSVEEADIVHWITDQLADLATLAS